MSPIMLLSFWVKDFNIAQGLIRMVGAGKIVRRGKMPSSLRDVAD